MRALTEPVGLADGAVASEGVSPEKPIRVNSLVWVSNMTRMFWLPGVLEGVGLGVLLGDALGDALGDDEGEADGEALGEAFGVGLADGDAEGEALGEAVEVGLDAGEGEVVGDDAPVAAGVGDLGNLTTALVLTILSAGSFTARFLPFPPSR